MPDRIRIGIIGTSGYAQGLLGLLATCENAEIAAICGRRLAPTEEPRSKFQTAQIFTDYQEIIRHGRLDGLIVASPDDLHYPMTMAALDAGLHVLCEKPMATNAAQAQEMLDAAERRGETHDRVQLAMASPLPISAPARRGWLCRPQLSRHLSLFQ